VAWPLALLAVPSLRRRDPLAVLVVVVAAALAATGYSVGGGQQWGGRFYAVLLVPVAVLVSGTIRALVARHGRALGVATIVGLGVVPTLGGLVAVGRVRVDNADAVAALRAVSATDSPALVATNSAFVATLDWQDIPDRLHVLLTGSTDLRTILTRVAAGGRNLTVVWPTAKRADITAGAKAVRIDNRYLAIRGYDAWRITPSP
jgi:hypothetical protein